MSGCPRVMGNLGNLGNLEGHEIYFLEQSQAECSSPKLNAWERRHQSFLVVKILKNLQNLVFQKKSLQKILLTQN